MFFLLVALSLPTYPDQRLGSLVSLPPSPHFPYPLSHRGLSYFLSYLYSFGPHLTAQVQASSMFARKNYKNIELLLAEFQLPAATTFLPAKLAQSRICACKAVSKLFKMPFKPCPVKNWCLTLIQLYHLHFLPLQPLKMKNTGLSLELGGTVLA